MEATPQFVIASATVGNPTELAERLTGLPFDEVSEDASPRGEKLFVLWNPPMVDEELGVRRGAVSETAWLLKELVESETRTIAFCRSRRGAELVAEFARRELPGPLRARVKAYRAGYLPEERRELERALSDGELLAVAATNALELGIDVGSLDAALRRRLPGHARLALAADRPRRPPRPRRRWRCWWRRTTRSTSTWCSTPPTCSTGPPRR